MAPRGVWLTRDIACNELQTIDIWGEKPHRDELQNCVIWRVCDRYPMSGFIDHVSPEVSLQVFGQSIDSSELLVFIPGNFRNGYQMSFNEKTKARIYE